MAPASRGQEIPSSRRSSRAREGNMAIETINPTTGERVQSYPALSEREIESKLASAHTASLTLAPRDD